MAAAGTLGQAPHGRKRAADSNLETEQRLSKRLDLLNLIDNNGTRLYVPVPGSHDVALRQERPRPIDAVPNSLASKSPRAKRPRARDPADDDSMQVEDTPHRVYISNLDAEISDIESDEERPVFLSDIEKHIAKIPHHVLAGPELKPTRENQLVLYSVPSSLTLPEEQDRVRKAIVEARARLRQKQASPVQEPESVLHPSPHGAAPALDEAAPMAVDDDDNDAMDIDG